MSEKFYSNFQEINDASDNLVKDHIIRFNDRVCLSQKQSLVAVPVYEINFTINQVRVFTHDNQTFQFFFRKQILL